MFFKILPPKTPFEAFISIFTLCICFILALPVCLNQSVCLHLYPRTVSMVTGTEIDQMGLFSVGYDFCGKHSYSLILQIGAVLKKMIGSVFSKTHVPQIYLSFYRCLMW